LTEGPAKQEIAFVVMGEPVGKPRMTRRDQWMRRPRVMRYRRWADEARLSLLRQLPSGRPALTPGEVSAIAVFAMPRSWSARKRAEMAGQPHRSAPDADNVGKALLDALFEQDKGVHTLSIRKVWDDGKGPRLTVLMEY
jgi:Holliday junction resolvase RusA-like endonuclease